MHRLQANRARPFSSDYVITRDSAVVTYLDLAAIRSRGEFRLEGNDYTVRTEGMLTNRVVLELGGRILLRAEREGLLPVRYRVYAGDRLLSLRPRLPGRTYVLRHGDRDIGTVRPTRLLSSSALAEFREALPLATEVFVLALVLLRWRQRRRSRSGG